MKCQQVTCFFSCLAAAKRVATESQDEEDEYQEEMEGIQEQNIQDLSDELSEMSIQHPIMYGMHNICKMIANTKLTKFSIQMLQDICSFYPLEIKSISAK